MAEPTTVSAAQPEATPQATPQAEQQAQPQQVQQPAQQVPAQTQTETPTPFSARGYVAKAFGNPELETKYQSDEQLLAELTEVARRSAAYARDAQAYQTFAPHMGEFQKWQAEQQKLQELEQSKKAQEWWQPPQYDPQWEKAIDPQTGLARPGFDPTIPQKLQAYHDFQRKMLNDLAQNPMKVLEPGLKGTIGPLIQETIRAELGQYQQHQSAMSYVNQNAGWLAQKDAQGNPLRNAQGGYALSPAGQIWKGHVEYLHSIGITDVNEQQRLAERLTEGDLLRAAMQSKQTAAPAPDTNGAPVNRIANLSGAQMTSIGEHPKGKSLAERLREDLKKAGVTDASFKN